MCPKISSRWLARGLLFAIVFSAGAQVANAAWVRIEFKKRDVGSWSLLGIEFTHTRTDVCVSGGLGDPPTQLATFVFPDTLAPPDLSITGYRFLGGPGAPAALAMLGGSPTQIFDATMFPAQPMGGYSIGTNPVGSDFTITPDVPYLLPLGSMSMFDYPGLFISTRLDLSNPNLVVGEATLSNGLTAPIYITAVPEPSTAMFLILGGVGVGGVALRRRRNSTIRF